jgi:antitoxin PrlF
MIGRKMSSESKITAKGQTTIPIEVRELLGLQAGDTLRFTVEGDRVLMTSKSVNFNDLAGFLGAPPNGPATLEEIDLTIAKNAGENAVFGSAKPRSRAA